MDLIRGLIKWIILAIIFIVLIVLVIRLANRQEVKNKVKEPTVNIVETTKDDVEDVVNDINEVPLQDDLTVDSPDTASTGIKETIIGFAILGFGAHYIYKRRNVKGNS